MSSSASEFKIPPTNIEFKHHQTPNLLSFFPQEGNQVNFRRCYRLNRNPSIKVGAKQASESWKTSNTARLVAEAAASAS
ncbi:hypothetical protein SORBI_3010G266400 [Sorghum bicolor]|uniref:Uncharacterized protein n=1 Tax=Sorghum bicolor TaxID=4558 RepID=A0A194YMR5_SORBI|nr:hypothetical protein SORBI_3010G266400 [Sorghum bicolor]